MGQVYGCNIFWGEFWRKALRWVRPVKQVFAKYILVPYFPYFGLWNCSVKNYMGPFFLSKCVFYFMSFSVCANTDIMRANTYFGCACQLVFKEYVKGYQTGLNIYYFPYIECKFCFIGRTGFLKFVGLPRMPKRRKDGLVSLLHSDGSRWLWLFHFNVE